MCHICATSAQSIKGAGGTLGGRCDVEFLSAGIGDDVALKFDSSFCIFTVFELFHLDSPLQAVRNMFFPVWSAAGKHGIFF